MAYSTVWDSNRPAGSTAAKQIDDEIRLVRGQLEERLEDVLITDITADPWVLKDAVKGKNDDLVKLIPFSAFASPRPDVDLQFSGVDNYVWGNDRNAHTAPIDIPAGCVVTQIDIRLQRFFVTSMDIGFYKQSFESGAGTQTAIARSSAATPSDSAISIFQFTDLNETIDTNSYYWISLKGIGSIAGSHASYKLYGAKITFNRASIAFAT